VAEVAARRRRPLAEVAAAGPERRPSGRAADAAGKPGRAARRASGRSPPTRLSTPSRRLAGLVPIGKALAGAPVARAVEVCTTSPPRPGGSRPGCGPTLATGAGRRQSGCRDHALELPGALVVWKLAPALARLRGGGQVSPGGAARPGLCATWRAPPGPGAGLVPDRRRRWSAGLATTRAWPGGLHRLAPGGRADRRLGGAAAQGPLARARWPRSPGGAARRRPRRRRRGRRGPGLRQRRPGLLRGQPGAGATGARRRPARAHAGPDRPPRARADGHRARPGAPPHAPRRRPGQGRARRGGRAGRVGGWRRRSSPEPARGCASSTRSPSPRSWP
jgi:hypothetical protein